MGKGFMIFSKSAASKNTTKTSAFSMRYSVYSLFVLFLVNMLILIDRQMMAVLSEDIKADLGLSDADIGFIYGTGISIFYAIFSIPLGRLADVWSRKSLISICVAAWSSMIFLSGTARHFLLFAFFRIGVGVGESGTGPAAMSTIFDHFEPRLRATAMSVVAAGGPIGAGVGLILGGAILDGWYDLYPDTALAPFGLKGWQVAFFCVAAAGPILAWWVASLKEPVRGQKDGLTSETHPHPFRELWAEMQSVLPFFSLLTLRRLDGDFRAVKLNVLIGSAIIATSFLLIIATGSVAQWSALGGGLWCVVCWAQTLALRDPATFAMIFKCRSFMFSSIGLALFVFNTVGVAGWIVPYIIRAHNVSPGEVGMTVGLLTTICGFTGTMVGGVLADMLGRYTSRATIYVCLGSVLLSAPSAVLMVVADDIAEIYRYLALFLLTSSACYGVGPMMINSLVMPRMRGLASAVYLIIITFLGVALGPYTIGFFSDLIAAGGADSGESLRQGILWGLTSMILSVIMLLIATTHLDRDKSSCLDRARALGESV
jgi:MFS family permease|tara:strand:- start:2016 stop:3644 length:1629 start_codon:yes stop_codon:yes gene_type:complete